MTQHATGRPAAGSKRSGLRSLTMALGLAVLTGTGASAAQHGTQFQDGQPQQMQKMPGGPSFESMRETMQAARGAQDPTERRKLMGRHMQMMEAKMQGMMAQMAKSGVDGGAHGASGQAAEMPKMASEQMQKMMQMMQMMQMMMDQQSMMMETEGD